MTKKVFILLTCHLLWLSVLSQNSSYIQYGIEDGLPQSQVRAIEQDSSGHLWVGTMSGISSFDGFEFSQLSKDDGLSANRINCIYQGSKLYIGSTGGVNYLNGRELVSIPLEKGLEEARILDIAEAKDGSLYLATDEQGLIKWSGEEFKYYNRDKGLPDSYIRSLCFDRDGKLWVGTRNGLVVLNEDVDSLTPPDLDIPILSVSQIRPTTGGLVVTTFGNGVYFFRQGEVKNHTEKDGLISDFIRCVVELDSGDYWFGSKTGLSRIKNGRVKSFDESNGLPYANIKCLGKDGEGNLWLGTDGQGLLRRTGDLFENYTSKDGLVSDLVMSIDRMGNGAFMVGTYDQGISVFSGDTAMTYSFNGLLPSPTVWAIEEINEKTLVGTSSGLYIDFGDGISTTISEQNGLPGNRVTAIHLKPNGSILLGTDNGIAWINQDFEVIKTVTEIEGQSVNGVRSIISLGDRTYCGSNAGVIELKEGREPKFLTQIPSEALIYSMALDSSKNLWVGSSNGLYRFDQKSEEIREIVFAKGVAAKNINFLSASQNNTLFIGTNDGLFSLDLGSYDALKEVNTRHYTKFEGLSSQETNQGAVFHDNEALWFGTTSGLVKLNLDAEKQKPGHLPLEISGIDLFLEKVEWKNLVDTFSVQSGLPVEPELQYNQNYLTFNYGGIYFKNPEKIRYRYMVEGVDDDWLGPTKSRSATYAYLPDGNFTFKVQAYQVDNPGVISEAGFEFSILPPFYKTLWFYLLVFLAVSAIVYRIYSARLQKERERREKIQLQLQSKLMELESQTLNSSMNRHFIFNALNSIQYYINMQDRKSANRYLTSFAKLIRKNLDSSQRMDTTLTEELERLELYLTLEQMRFQQKFTYNIVVEKSINTDDVVLPAMMLQPFLENSIWHGILPSQRDGSIEIDISKKEAHWEIQIDDNGVGIKTSLANKNGNHTAHASHGMDITMNRVRLYRNMTGLKYQIDGPYERQDNNGQILGTRVIIRIPKKETVPELSEPESWNIREHNLS